MTVSRIIGYDGPYVTFWYQRYEDDEVVIERSPAFQFIVRLVLHITNKNFKYIRCYGCYNESIKIITAKMKEIYRKYNEKSIELKKVINKWRLNIYLSFNIDSLKCPNGMTIMIYTQSVWQCKTVSNFFLNHE